MDGNDDLRRRSSAAHPGRGGRIPSAAPPAALLAVAALAVGAVLVLVGDGAGRPGEATFLNEALGARDASAPLVRTPAPGVRVRLAGGGYTVAGPGGTVGLRAVQNGGPLVRHANGVSQTTPFGSAAVVVDRDRTEQFLTVTRRQGTRTWRWQLETGLVPRVGADGAVVFLSRSSRRVAGPVLAPVEILDARGRVVTPEGARWSTGRNRHGWELRLALDDSELPLPYVIDPAVTHDATTVSNNGAAGANNIGLAYPPGVAQDDLLVATIAVRGNVTVGTPAGWSAGRSSRNGTNVRLFTFYKVAGAGEPASQTFTWGGAQQAVGAISAYYGVRSSLGNPAVLDVMGAAATGNSATASAASITTLTADALVVASYGINNNGTFGAVTGMTERWDAASASATPGSRASGSQHDMTQAAPGATGAKSSALGATRRWAAHQHSFEVDNVDATITPTTPAVGRATLNLTSTVADADSGVASVLYERSPAGAGTWTTVGTSTTSPFSFPFDTTTVADGLYDIRATVTDWAGNTATATTLLRVDNSSPDQNALTLTPLTGTANQYWDGTNRVLYYNPAVAGTFSLSSVPRDVIPPISFVGGSGGASNNSPLTLTVPAGVQAGDLLIAQVGYERTTAISVPTPAGWTRHVDRDNGTIYGQVIFYRWATASEPASYTIPHASAAASLSGTLLAYRGVASASPVLVNDGTVASGTTLTAPSVTTPAGCGRLVAFYGLWNTATLTTPAGMTLRATAINTEAGWNSRVLAADEILGAAGATGTRVSTATVTGTNTTGPGSNVSELLALRPLACVSSVQYPAPGQTGFTGGGNTDTVEPYAASPDYSFGPANTVEPGARTITISDEAGNPALTQTITFTRDVAAPTTTDDTGTITNAWRNVDTTVTLTPGDGAGAGVAQTYYTTDGSTPTTASPTGTSILLSAEGTYTITYFSTDRVANAESVQTGAAQIRIDKTAPTTATLDPLPAAIRNGQSLTGGGSDGLSGVGSITYLYCAGAACTPATAIGSSSTAAGGYAVTWNSQPTDGTYRIRARAFDSAGNQLDSAIQTVTIDNTNPSGSVTAPAAGANVRGSSVSVASDSADGSGSGVASALFQRSPAGADTWTTIGGPDTTSPYGVTWDTTAVADGLYDLRVVTTDNAGNAFTSGTVANVRVDNGLPAQTLSPTGVSPADAAHLSGNDLFYRGAAAGQLRIRSAVSDGGSGPASSTTSALGGTSTGWTHTPGTVSSPAGGPYDSNLFSWGAGTTTSPTVDVHATDAAGNDSATTTLTLRDDSTAPSGGALTVNGVAATPGGTASDSAGSFAIGVRIDWSETASATASGLASSTLTRESATFANGTCGSYGGSTAIVGSPAQTLAPGCYRYTLTGVDNVGNSVSVSTVVRVHGAVDRFAVEAAGGGAIGSQTAGSPFALRVTALDAGGNTVTSFGGTVDITSDGGLSSGGGTTAALTNGVLASHSVTLTSAGSRTITATRTSGGSQSGTSAAFAVGHASLSDFLVEAAGGGAIGAQTVDAPFSIRVTARDAYGNTVTSFDGVGNTVDLTSGGTLSAGGGTTPTFSNGVLASHSVTVSSPGATTLTATRTSGGAQTGTSASFNVGNATFTQNAPAGVTGTAKVGQTLTRAAGDWSPAPTGRSYQWRRCDAAGASCADIAGATGTTYDLVAADLGATIRVVETASKAGYTDAVSTSAQTAVVAAGTIANTAAPTVAGSATTTSTLTATRGTWTPSGTTGAFQWVRCDADGSNCADIAGATASTYVVAAADVGKKLKVRETASKAGYADASADSALTDVVVDTDVTPPTNTITLAAADGAYLSGTTVFYNGAAGGSFTLSSAVADAGAGPGSAVYPPLFGYAGGTVSTPAGGPFLSGSIAWSAGTSGSFPYVVTARDAWTPANESQTTLTLADDSTGPAASALCNGAACSAGWYTSAPVSVTLAGNDGSGSGVAQLRYTLDGSDPTAISGFAYSAAFDVSGQGATTVKARAFDRVGNAGPVTTITIRIDTVAPQTTLDSTPAAATQDTTPTFAYSADETATFQWRLGGGSWTTEAGPVTLGPLADGTYLFEVRATDVAGNVDASPASFTFTVDTAAADTTVTSAPPAATNATAASFSFTATDAGPSFDCRLDGGAWTACTSPQSYGGLTEASHTFEVRARDAAGNVDPTPASRTWTVDLTAPDTSFLSTPADPSANPTPTFGLGSTESPSTFECRLDGGAWSACATPFTTPTLGDGSHTLQVRATDAAGNTDASAASFTWLVDATAPTGSITNPLDGAALGGTVALASNSADAGGSGVATVVFQRTPAGGSTWTNQASSWDTTLVADGDYDLRVVTTDNAGNAFTSPVITVTVDSTEPSLAVTAPNPVNLATADPATITATAADGGSGIANVRFDQCAEDSPACVSDSWVLLAVDTGAPYSASWPIPSDGPRLLRVRATDNAGRQRTELVLVTVDRIRPTGSLTAPAAGANLRGAAVALAATASDTAPGTVNAVTFQVSPAGAGSWSDVGTDASAPYTGTLDTTALADGLYDLRVFTTDAAGNAEAAPATVQVRVDNTNPTGSMTSPAASANVRGTITLTSSSADAGSGVATVQFERSPAGAGAWTTQAASFDTTSVADGLYDLRVTTTDNAGNSFTSASVEVRVDNTSPTGSVTSPAAGANVRGTVMLTSSSADSGSGVATVQFQRSPAGAGTWTNQAAGFDTSAVADGLYDLRVTTTDNAGNSFTSGTVQVRVDNTNPTGSVTAPANGAEIGVAPVTLTSDSADTGSGIATIVFERSPAGAGTWTATPATWDTASGPDAVADGQYDLRVRTTDNAGNVFTSAAITVLVDHTAPTTTASLSPGSPSSAPVAVSFNAGDGSGSGVSVVSYRVDGGGLQSGAAVVIPAPGDNSNDGAHLVEFFSTDEVGNVEAVKSVTVVIDTTAPSGTGGDPGDYLRGLATLTYSTTATDVSSVQFQFSPAGAGAWTNVGAADLAPPYEASWNTTLVADGPYDLRAVVTDTTGNVANTLLPGLPKTVDNTAPSGSVTAPLAAAFVSGSVAVDASAADSAVPPASGVSAVRFEVRPAGAGAFSVFGTQVTPVVGSTYRQSLDTTSLADGPTELRVVVTDVAGNETTSATRTVSVDNDAPIVTLDDPGAAVGSTATLTASASADTASVAFRYRAVGSGGAGTLIDTDTTAPFGVAWSTAPAAEAQWELIAVATDAGGNTGTSAPRTVLVDRTQPTGSVTAPAAASTVGGPSVPLAAAAADTGGSGVARVEWFVRVFGSSTFASVASDTTAPYTATWDATTAPDGAAEVRAEITDAAGNVRTTAVNTVTVDSTGPSVTLADPGAVLAGTVALSATTGSGAARVVFSVSPADAGTWTQIGEDTSSPFGADFDTTVLADGLYDVRAIGYDALGNPSAPSLREDVRLDNTAPTLVSSTPADGSVSASASQIELTVSEPVTIVGATLDGGPAPAPTVSGTTITYPTGALADGLHVLFGWLEDASGTRTPFRVALTVESTPRADRPPVEKSASRAAAASAVAAGSLARVTVPPRAWPSVADPADFLVVSVDPTGTTPSFGPGLTAASQIIDVTARWALAGTPVTEFAAPIEVLIPNTSGGVVIPATSDDGTAWRALEPVEGTTLPAGARDGYYVDAAGVHILTRHLTLFALGGDVQGPTPPHSVAGEMRADGLTIRWIPGRDSSGRLGNVVLFVNGEPYQTFGPTEYEAKLGPVLENDTRSFYLVQHDAAGNPSGKSVTLRALPRFLGLGLDAARAALAARGIGVGSVTYRNVPGAVPGTVIGPENLIFFVEGGSVDLVVAGTAAAAAGEAQLAFQVASAKRIKVRPKRTTVPVSILVTRPATVTGMLFSAERAKLYTWRLEVAAGRTVVKLRLPAQVRKPGLYRIVWVARSGGQTVRRSVPFRLVGRRFQQVQAPKKPVEVVLTGGRDLRGGVGANARVVATATPDRTFLLVASRTRNVTVVVVDVDRHGLRFVRDLHAVFPELRIVAVARRERTREASLKAGAARALPR